MPKRARTACPLCKKTGVCILCEGKGTFALDLGFVKIKERSAEQTVPFTELDCRLCLKTGECPLCDGEGYIRMALPKVEKDDYKKKREDLLVIKQRILRLRELEALKREIVDQKSLNNKDN